MIVLDADEEHFPDDLAHRRLLHVGATRAIHQLWLLHTRPVSPVVAEAIADTQRQREASEESA